MNLEKILITGGAGFIGYHLTKGLLNSNKLVVCIDNLNDYYNSKLKQDRLKDLGFDFDSSRIHNTVNSNFSFLKMDINDSDKLNNLFQKHQFDIVIHLAAQAGVRHSLSHPESYITTNINGFFNVIDQCKTHKVKKLIYASSSSVYGLNSKFPYSETLKVNTPISLYAASKISNELIAHSYSHLYGLNTIGLRFFTVYGPWGRPDMAYYKFSDLISRNKPIEVYNNGLNKRDFTYIDDVINCIIKIINNKVQQGKYNIFNIGNSKSISVEKFISIIEKNLNKKAIKNYINSQKGDVNKTLSDTSLIKKRFAYEANTDIELGLKFFCEWYLSYNAK